MIGTNREQHRERRSDGGGHRTLFDDRRCRMLTTCPEVSMRRLHHGRRFRPYRCAVEPMLSLSSGEFYRPTDIPEAETNRSACSANLASATRSISFDIKLRFQMGLNEFILHESSVGFCDRCQRVARSIRSTIAIPIMSVRLSVCLSVCL